MPASASSWGRRSWRVPKGRSPRPLALRASRPGCARCRAAPAPGRLGSAGPWRHLPPPRGVQVVAAAVGVELHGQAVPRRSLRPARRSCSTCLLPRPGRPSRSAGGVVHGDDQVERRLSGAARRAASRPDAAHAAHRPARPFATMGAVAAPAGPSRSLEIPPGGRWSRACNRAAARSFSWKCLMVKPW